jgi:lipoprotein-anchoring transpeptidase ErfK/SrfK
VKQGLFIVCAALALAASWTLAAGSSAGVEPVAPAAAAPGKPVVQTGARAARTPGKVVRKAITLPARVRIAGVRVGKLPPARAEKVVQRAFTKPLTVVIDRRSLRLDPRKLAKAYVEGAVGHARAAKPGTSLPLVVSVRGAAVRAWAKKVAARTDRKPAKVGLVLRDGKPYIGPLAYGKRLDQGELVQRVVRALAGNTRLPVRVKTKKLLPLALPTAKSPVIVINRGENTLSLYHGTKPWRTFRVATGSYSYPTPRGRFGIVVKWTNPWWYPPASDWAAGQSPIPPGPGNPLGTRWMGISSPGVGIHGTPNPGSIGYSLSHGCIRMHIPEAEWLYEQVDVGTTVFIV